MKPSGWLMRRPRLRGGLRLAIIAAGLWLILTEGRMLGPEALLVIAAAVWVGAAYAPRYMYRWRPLRLLIFVAYFVRRSLAGGVDVAYRALHPGMPIRPALVRHRLRVNLDQPRTLIVAVVSLMPGTLAAEIRGNELTVHLLAPGMEGEVEALERQVAALFKPAELEQDGPSAEGRW